MYLVALPFLIKIYQYKSSVGGSPHKKHITLIYGRRIETFSYIFFEFESVEQENRTHFLSPFELFT